MCDHKEYNELCARCLEIKFECEKAETEGLADFRGKDWSYFVEYMNRSEEEENDIAKQEEQRDYEDEETERQIIDARAN